ncbi:GNS1/SUR4 membrane protein [Cristinia sonorae]|uniref:Elongation of fatty acids protein n=1 Tax=Cristinia sonorae TaxID=1940300 RepID=A0A8K0UPS2_9AGAR|nr:GNS1/SUR4 membrane protein [Cristinia sonorae]
MAPIADFILNYVPLPKVPYYLTSYVPGKTPLSTPQEVYPALVTYLVVIFSIQWFMKDRPALKLQYPFQAHNVFLSAGSLLLLVLMLEEVIPSIWKHGVFYGMCNVNMWTPRMEFYYMINYSFKYIELIDTVFLALKKKPLAFLHVFHHSATALLCYSQLEGRTSVSWVVISLNLAVHVVMYYYYYATAGGARIWWKKYLTTMQITQFVIDLCAVYFGTYSYYAATYWHFLPHLGTCAGTEYAALFGCGLLSSYLLLFINFYIQTYKAPAKGKKTSANGKAVANGNGVANGHKKD